MTIFRGSLFRRLFLINLLITLGFGISDAFFPLYCQDIGARGLLLGVAVGGYALSKIFFSPLMGGLADRFGHRKPILASLGLYLLISSSYLATDSLAMIVALRLLQGAGCAMFRPVLQALVSEQAAPERRATAMGTFDISFYAGIGIGPVIGGLLMDAWGFRALFAALGACCFLAFMLALHGIPPKGTGGGTPVPGARRISWAGVWPAVPDHGTLRGLLVFILGRGCGITACATFLPILLSTKLGLSGLEVGVIMASASLVMTLLLRPVGKAADRFPRDVMVTCGGLAVPLLYLMLPLAADFREVLGLILGIGAFSALSQPAASALLAEEGQRLGMGSTFGTFNAVLNLGFVLGPLVGSLLQQVAGVQSVFIAIGIIGLLTGSVFTLTARLPGRSARPVSVE